MFLLSTGLALDAVTTALGFTLPLVVLAYTILRTPRRDAIFLLAMAPNVVSVSLPEFGASRWIGWLLAVPVLLVLARWDVADRAARKQ
jgi:hypothetical protein